MNEAPDIIALRTEATAYAKAHNGFPFRSCWHCNPAHEWMSRDKKIPYNCFECGHIYFKGVRITDEET